VNLNSKAIRLPLRSILGTLLYTVFLIFLIENRCNSVTFGYRSAYLAGSWAIRRKRILSH